MQLKGFTVVMKTGWGLFTLLAHIHTITQSHSRLTETKILARFPGEFCWRQYTDGTNFLKRSFPKGKKDEKNFSRIHLPMLITTFAYYILIENHWKPSYYSSPELEFFPWDIFLEIFWKE